MSPSITANDFLALVEKSGLLDSAALGKYRESLKTGSAAEATPDDLASRLVNDGLLTAFQARKLVKGRYRGFFIAEKYKILEPINEGGMGRVFLCEQLLLSRLVAVKIMSQSTDADPGTIERFVREARATATLDHRNIARAIDIEQTSAGPCIVMEYVDGTSLQEIVDRHGPLAIDRAAHYIAQTAAGLQHAHQASLVHRDIKPANILLDRSGTIKLLDLGLARFCRTEKNDNLTQRFNDQAVMGTADYISPEQVTNSSRVDIRADIYSLGCTFYFLLSGKPPFDSATLAEKLIYHQGKNPRSMRELRPETPKELVDVLEKMLCKQPEKRFQTPAEVASALAAWTKKGIGPPRPEEMHQFDPKSFKLGLSPQPRLVPGKSGTHAVTPRPSASQTDTHRQTDARLAPPPPSAPEFRRRFARRHVFVISALILVAFVGATWAAAKWLAPGGVAINNAAISNNDRQRSPDAGQGRQSGDGSLAPASAATGVVLRSGGSSFMAPLMEHWAPLYQQQSGTKIDYASLGSSHGVEGVVKHFLDFGCTDAFLSDEQLAAAGGSLVHIPLALGAVVATYNVTDASGQPLRLRFTGPLLASIYLGRATKWNDPMIAVNNPGKKLPDLDIHVVHRSDGSGTTSIWTDYLSKASAEWRSHVGVGNQVDWPVGEGAEKNDGVADAVSRVAGAVGYVEFSYALANGLEVGQVKNKAGVFIEPSVESVTAAAVGSVKEIPADLRYSLTDAAGKSSYPISGTCWAVAYVDQPPEKRAELIKFLHWATHDGQQFVRDLHFAPLPAEIISRVDEAIKRFDGEAVR